MKLCGDNIHGWNCTKAIDHDGDHVATIGPYVEGSGQMECARRGKNEASRRLVDEGATAAALLTRPEGSQAIVSATKDSSSLPAVPGPQEGETCYEDHATGEIDHMNAHIRTRKCAEASVGVEARTTNDPQAGARPALPAPPAAPGAEDATEPVGRPAFVDTPVMQAQRRAFDHPTIANLDALIEAVRAERAERLPHPSRPKLSIPRGSY